MIEKSRPKLGRRTSAKPQLTGDDNAVVENILRPQFLDDYIGRDEVKHNLKSFCLQLNIGRKPMGHTLLHGPPD